MANKLTIKQLEKLKSEFIQQRDEILSLCQERNKEKNAEIDIDGDDVDLIQGVLLSSITEKLSQRDSAKLLKINNALIKISSGTFGLCEECEEPINKKRLLARPEAELCIFCAEKAEINAKHYLNKK